MGRKGSKGNYHEKKLGEYKLRNLKKFLHEKSFIEVGYVRKPYGYKGDVKINAEDIFEEDIMESQFIFIHQRGLKVPFKIIESQLNPELTIKFDYINSSEEAESIVGEKVFLLESEVKHAKDYLDKDQEQNQVVGFLIKDKPTNQQFEIIRIEEFPQQLMAVISRNGVESYIPLNDEFILEVIKEEKIIHMDLPEGLLDL